MEKGFCTDKLVFDFNFAGTSRDLSIDGFVSVSKGLKRTGGQMLHRQGSLRLPGRRKVEFARVADPRRDLEQGNASSAASAYSRLACVAKPLSAQTQSGQQRARLASSLCSTVTESGE